MRPYLLLLIPVIVQACFSSRPATEQSEAPVKRDTVFITRKPSPQDYRASYTRRNDLLHTDLEVSFNMEKSWLFGKATLTFTPWFNAVSHLELDAKGFEINEVSLIREGKHIPLSYRYDSLRLDITLDREYKADEKYMIYIDYKAKPDELEEGGSAAIASDKGLYFINGDGKDPNKPQQIWTQGETEASSCWFPTIDKPNERTTQRIAITVDTSFMTLSNGEMTSSANNGNGTRTDTWEMKLPHAPYLFMMAIGKYAVTKEKWRGKEVSYYVERGYAPWAKEIFPNTVEMLDFFSAYFGYDYPWNKFSQVVVRDYVSGAMENTTAVIFRESIQRTPREMIDENGEAVVAHEMAHHWFGDLVTCESWSNLTLNESLASYAEHLWFNHKYGVERASYEHTRELRGFLWAATRKQRPIVDFWYDDKEDMFDSHSYGKGSLVLAMLHNYVGEEAFRAGLKKYLTDNAFDAAEIHDLRLAFEEVTGEDLNWFFNQWWFSPGHPKLEISYEYTPDSNGKVTETTVVLKQTPSHEDAPVFVLPMAIDIYANDGSRARHHVTFDQAEERFNFPADGKPLLVNVDADKKLLCEKEDKKTTGEFVYQYFNGPLYADRLEALVHCLAAWPEADTAGKVIIAALDDPFYPIRNRVLESMDSSLIDIHKEKVMLLASADPGSHVRSAAVNALANLERDSAAIAAIRRGLEDTSFLVIRTALRSLFDLDPAAALGEARRFEKENNRELLSAVAAIYADTGSAQDRQFFIRVIASESGYDKFLLISSFLKFLNRMEDTLVGEGLAFVNNQSFEDFPNWLSRHLSKNALEIRSRYDGRRKQLEERIAEGGEGVEQLTADLETVMARIGQVDLLLKKFPAAKS